MCFLKLSQGRWCFNLRGLLESVVHSVNLYLKNIATGTDTGTQFFPVLVEDFHKTVS